MIDYLERRRTPVICDTVIEFIEYSLIFTIIIECNSLFHYSENYRQTTVEVVLTVIAIGLTILLTGVFGYQFRKAFHEDLKKTVPLFVILYGSVIVFFALNVMRVGSDHSIPKYLLSFMAFFPLSYFLFRLYRLAGKPYELFYKYSSLVCVVAVVNLIFYAVLILHPEIVQTQLTNSRWSGFGHLTSFLNSCNICCVSPSSRHTIAGFAFYVNNAFFPEPLMYCIPLTVALYTELFLREKKERQIWKWAILSVAVFTTQSTLGMILTVAAIGLKLLEEAKPKHRYLALFALVFVVASVFVLFRRKLNTGGSGSIAAHIEHYRCALKTFLEHPLFGCGYLREDQIRLHMSAEQLKRSEGLSNSVFVVLAEGGVFLGLLCMAPLLAWFKLIKSSDKKRIALWALGPFGLYCGTVIHFHLLMMLIMSFGYSLVEFTSKDGGNGRLVLSDSGESAEKSDSVQAHTLTRGQRMASAAVTILACSTTAALFLSGGFWKAISQWMRLHQLYLGQSAWKAYFFFLFLLFAVLVVRKTICVSGQENRKLRIVEAVWFVVFSIAYYAVYPVTYSLASTGLDLSTPFGDFFETAALAVLYWGGIAIGWGLTALFHINKRFFAAGIAVVGVLVFGIAVGIMHYIPGIAVQTAGISADVKIVADAAKGKIYANNRQIAMKRALPELSFSSARDGAFSALTNVSVIAPYGKNLRDLIEAGFQVTALSSEYLLYSNDDAVIRELRSRGHSLYKYYPYPMSVDNSAAIILTKGNYTLSTDLQMTPRKDASHTPTGRIRITAYDGTQNVEERIIYADEFDEDGYCRIVLSFDAGNWEGMDYQVIPENGYPVQVKALSLTATPKFIVEITYDGRRQSVREDYYCISGEPYIHPAGYSAITSDYDRAGRLIRQSYFNGSNVPVCIKSGYASYTREYDVRGRLKKEAYFDEDGKPCLSIHGYASYEREFDSHGCLIALRYLGVDDKPIMTDMGYAETRCEFNHNRQLTVQQFFDENGFGIMLPEGYCIERREYDFAGNVIVQQYYDADRNPVITAFGYAEVRREYNAEERIISEAYYGTKGEPVALKSGVSFQKFEYGVDGKVAAQYSYGLNGEKLTDELG